MKLEKVDLNRLTVEFINEQFERRKEIEKICIYEAAADSSYTLYRGREYADCPCFEVPYYIADSHIFPETNEIFYVYVVLYDFTYKVTEE